MPKDQWLRANMRARYGPSSSMGRPRTRRTRQRPEKHSDQKLFFTVPAGTVCSVRRLGDKTWQPHTTRLSIVCLGFLWRNRTHYGFEYGSWEIKVPIGSFHQRQAKQPAARGGVR